MFGESSGEFGCRRTAADEDGVVSGQPTPAARSDESCGDQPPEHDERDCLRGRLEEGQHRDLLMHIEDRRGNHGGRGQ